MRLASARYRLEAVDRGTICPVPGVVDQSCARSYMIRLQEAPAGECCIEGLRVDGILGTEFRATDEAAQAAGGR